MSPAASPAPPVQNTIEWIDLEQLKFDPLNPRLPEHLRGAEDEDAVIDWMLSSGAIVELMGSIGETGYFPGEPLLAVEAPEGGYHVVEGNRRLTAAKLLVNPDRATTKRKAVRAASAAARELPTRLPTIVFPDRKDILVFLGYRHITGVKPWTSLAKAKYLNQLREADPTASFAELARNIGSRSDYVARLLVGLAVYDLIRDRDYFGIRGLEEETISFSVLTTALSYAKIGQFLGIRDLRDPGLPGLDLAHLEELTRWLFEKTPENTTRIGESRNLRILNEVVAERDALAAFRRGVPLEEAGVLTDAPAEAFHSLVVSARDHLQTAKMQSHHVQAFTQGDGEVLSEVQSIARDLRVLVATRSIMDED